MWQATLKKIDEVPGNNVVIHVLFHDGDREMTKELKLAYYNYKSIDDVKKLIDDEILALESFDIVKPSLESLVDEEI